MSDTKDYSKGRILIPYRVGIRSDMIYDGIGLMWGNGDLLTDEEADHIIDCFNACRGFDPKEVRALLVLNRLENKLAAEGKFDWWIDFLKLLRTLFLIAAGLTLAAIIAYYALNFPLPVR